MVFRFQFSNSPGLGIHEGFILLKSPSTRRYRMVSTKLMKSSLELLTYLYSLAVSVDFVSGDNDHSQWGEEASNTVMESSFSNCAVKDGYCLFRERYSLTSTPFPPRSYFLLQPRLMYKSP